MTEERRNLYRILHVQPEAPSEVIRASYRTLMSTLRAHPDLGGDPQAAARINAAYAVLTDPARRRDYDRTLARPAATRSAPEALATAGDPATWLADRCCPFCRRSLPAAVHADTRCAACESPLMRLPALDRGELFGRRRAPRNARPMPATLRLARSPGDHAGRVRDLSLTGLCVLATVAPRPRTAVRVITATFDAVAVVISSPREAGGHAVHGELLTLQMLRSAGVFVSAKA